MFIGSSRDCREFCKQSSKALFDSAHSKQRHSILDIKSFKDQNKNYIQRVQKAWQPFNRQIEVFFLALRKELELIERDAKSRLLQEQLKTAVNSTERRLIDLSRNIFSERFDRITCKEVDEYIDIKERLENSRNFLRIVKNEQDFALDLLDDIKKAVQSIGKSLTESKKRERERQKERQYETPKEPPKGQQTRNQARKENRQRDEWPQRVQNRKNERRQQDRQYRRDYRKRDENGQTHKNAEREERQPRRQAKRQENRDYRRPERQPRQNVRRQQERKPEKDIKQRKERAERPNKVFKKMKIIDLTSTSDEFSIEVKFISLLKNLRDRDVWKVTDGSGEIKLVIPEHESFKVGTNATINNCFVRSHGEELQVVTKLYSTITSPQIGNNVDIGSLLKNNKNRNNNRERVTPSQTFKQLSKIADLEPGLQNLKLICKVVSAKSNKNVIQCVLGDETGIVNARFDCGEEFLKPDNTVYLRDVQTEITGEAQGTILLVPGKRVLIENAREQIKKVKEENNISNRIYQACDE